MCADRQKGWVALLLLALNVLLLPGCGEPSKPPLPTSTIAEAAARFCKDTGRQSCHDNCQKDGGTLACSLFCRSPDGRIDHAHSLGECRGSDCSNPCR